MLDEVPPVGDVDHAVIGHASAYLSDLAGDPSLALVGLGSVCGRASQAVHRSLRLNILWLIFSNMKFVLKFCARLWMTKSSKDKETAEEPKKEPKEKDEAVEVLEVAWHRVFCPGKGEAKDEMPSDEVPPSLPQPPIFQHRVKAWGSVLLELETDEMPSVEVPPPLGEVQPPVVPSGAASSSFASSSRQVNTLAGASESETYPGI